MLARLDEIEGIDESRVDWSGRNILLRLAGRADAEVVIREASQHLGPGVARLEPARESERVEGFRRGEPWLKSGETLRLSVYESKVLGKSLAARAGKGVLTPEETKRLEAIIEEEFLALFKRIHAGEFTLGEALERTKDEIAPRLQEKLSAFVPSDRVSRIMESLRVAVLGE